MPLRGLWREPDFLKLWAGQTVSQVGSWITLVAVSYTHLDVYKRQDLNGDGKLDIVTLDVWDLAGPGAIGVLLNKTP